MSCVILTSLTVLLCLHRDSNMNSISTTRSTSVSPPPPPPLPPSLLSFCSQPCHPSLPASSPWGVLVGCLTSQQHASVSQGWICTDNFTCCHTEIEGADQTLYLTQSQYTDTGPTSPGADPITPGACQGSHRSANFEVTGMTRPGKIPSPAGFEPLIFRSRRGRLNH